MVIKNIALFQGFPLGSKEAVLSSQLGHGQGPILLDELRCKGTEETILDCQFNPWTKHDCQITEWAGVICKTEDASCAEELWRCDHSGECISLEQLCDNRNDCVDGSDEESIHCDAPVEVRLSEGNNVTTGRVEVKYKGVWGTICDDNFGPEEGQVVCRMLGFPSSTAIIHSEAAFNPGSGPIWVHSIACHGSESSLKECRSADWAPSYHCRHLEDVGIECIPQSIVK